jgi:hypothetical protein
MFSFALYLSSAVSISYIIRLHGRLGIHPPNPIVSVGYSITEIGALFKINKYFIIFFYILTLEYHDYK